MVSQPVNPGPDTHNHTDDICQINDGGKFYTGYLGKNKTFYKYIGTGIDQQHESTPLIAAPANTAEIEPQETMTYLSGTGDGHYASFVFDEKKLALHFTQFRVRQFKKRSEYLPMPFMDTKMLKHRDYEIVEMVELSKPKKNNKAD